MQQKNLIPLWAAILINLNIMLGVGIFINTVVLAKLTGILGFLSYITVGILMLPLILSMAKLVSVVPSGSFYAFGKTLLHPVTGFISSWSYFWGKLASATLMIHTFAILLQTFIPITKTVSIFTIDIVTIIFFVLLNLLNIKTNMRIQMVFFFFKMLPILFAIFVGAIFYYRPYVNFDDHALWAQFPASLALVLYAFTGFEASCSLSASIQNAKKNAGRAILISYIITVCLCVFYQFLAFASIGSNLATFSHFSQFFASLVMYASSNETLIFPLKTFLYAAMAISSLGGAYGIIFSNNWNMYYLAQDDHVPFATHIKQFNRYLIPYWCVVLEGLICFMYLFVTQGNQIPLQQIGALGCILAYTTSIIALSKGVFLGNIKFNKMITTFAVGNCLLLISATVISFITTAQFMPFLIFLSILFFGLLSFFVIGLRKKNQNKNMVH